MSLRSRLFLGIAGTVIVSLVVTVVAGALLTRRSLEATALSSLERQVDLIATQRRQAPARDVETELGRFLATDEQRLAILTPEQAELLLPEAAGERLEAGSVASGKVGVRGTQFLYAARRSGDEAIVLLRPAASQAADWTPFALGLGLAGLVGAALAAAVAFLLARAVSRPVARVSEASRALAAGERPEPLPVAGPREVATLASSFNHLSGELDKAQDAERTFLLSVSHELKTPLTAIRGHAEALEDGVLEPEAAGLVIEREARRLERLVGDLLDLARLRRRSFSVRAEPLDLAELSVLAVQRHEVGRTLVPASGSRPCRSPTPGRSATRIACSRRSRTSSRTPCARPPPAARCGSSPAPADSRSSTTVPGSPRPTCRGRSSASTSTTARRTARRVGTGLGLAIVHELAQAMGGEALVRSTPGVGSTFSLVLPRATAATPARAGEASPAP